MDTPSGHAPHRRPFLYLAPIQGVTDALFRNIFHQHFGGFDAAVSPFINLHRYTSCKEKGLRDILPKNNSGPPLIPQLLNTDPDDFLALADCLQDLGYTHINWNLGCPAPMVARKKRGSGILPYPEMIVELLETIMPRLKVTLSIKTRLGYNDPGEILALLPRLDAFPLHEIIIHARLGRQLYSGEVDLAAFARCHAHSAHTLVYNGDITDCETFQRLSEQFPWVSRWMIGRGVLADPFLAQALRGERTAAEDRLARLHRFHDELYQAYRQRLVGPGHLLGRMKQLWIYLIASFPGKEKILKKITKSHTEQHYLLAVDELFDGW